MKCTVYSTCNLHGSQLVTPTYIACFISAFSLGNYYTVVNTLH
jgi:hypothetical protein